MWQGLVKRLAIVALAVAFFSGTMPPSIAVASPAHHAMAGVADSGHAGMHGQCSDCNGAPTPSPTACPDMAACVATPAAAVLRDPSIAITRDTTPTAYAAFAPRLTGRTVPPDLSPPIIRA